MTSKQYYIQNSTRQFKAQTESAAGLVKGNEVREGGFRIGVIDQIRAVTLPDGRTVSEMRMKLDRKVGEVPVDTSLTIRPRSALGLKYVEFRRGDSARKFRDGDLIPLNQSTVPVQIDDVNKLFDERTRRASQVNLTEFGNAFTGRGGDPKRTIEALPRPVGSLAPVMGTLGD